MGKYNFFKCGNEKENYYRDKNKKCTEMFSSSFQIYFQKTVAGSEWEK